MYRLFRPDRPTAFLLLLLALPVLWLPVFLAPMGLAERQHMPLFAPVADLVERTPWTGPLLGMLATAAALVLLDRIANDLELFERRTRLPALVFLLLLAAGPTGLSLGPALLAMPLVLLAMRRTLGVQGGQRVLGPLFDAGLLIGTAALVYLPYAFMVVAVWATVSVLRPFAWREYVVPFLGMLLPLYLVFLGGRLSGVRMAEPLGTVMRLELPSAWDSPRFARLATGSLLLLLAASLAAYARSYGHRVMRGKGMMAALLAHALALSVLVVFELFTHGRWPSVLVAFPLALLSTYLLLPLRKAWVGEVVVLLLLLLAVGGQWPG